MANYHNVISFKGDLTDIDSKLLALKSSFGSAYDSLGKSAKHLSPALIENIKNLDKMGVKSLELKGKLQSLRQNRGGILKGTIDSDIESLKKAQQELKDYQNKYKNTANPQRKKELKPFVDKAQANVLKEYNNQVSRLKSGYDSAQTSVKIYVSEIDKLQKSEFRLANSKQQLIEAEKKSKEQTRTATIALKDKLLITSKAEQVERKYADAIREINALEKQGVISSRQATQGIKSQADARKRELIGLKNNNSAMNDNVRLLRQMGTLVGVYYAATTAFQATLGVGIQVNRMVEDNTSGIAALLSASTKMIDSNGNVLTSIEKFHMGLDVATDTMEDLRLASVKTYATFPQLTEIFQQAIGQTLAMGNSFGTTTDQIIENTVALSQRMSNIAGSIGMPMDKAREEIRSLLSGNASTDSLISTMIFGSPTAANKAIKEAKTRGANGVKDMLDGMLSPFDVLADVDSYSRSMLALEDAWKNTMAEMSKPLFDTIATGAKELSVALNDNKDDVVELYFKFLDLADTGLDVAMALGSVGASIFDILTPFDSLNNSSDVQISKMEYLSRLLGGFSMLLNNGALSLQLFANGTLMVGEYIDKYFTHYLNKNLEVFYKLMGGLNEFQSFVSFGDTDADARAKEYYALANSIDTVSSSQSKAFEQTIKNLDMENLALAKQVKSWDEIVAIMEDQSSVKPTDYVTDSLKKLEVIEEKQANIALMREHISDIKNGAALGDEKEIKSLEAKISLAEKQLKTEERIFKNRNNPSKLITKDSKNTKDETKETKKRLALEKKLEASKQKQFKEQEKAIKDQFKLSTQALKIDALRFELENGEVDKLDVLQKELVLLDAQSVVGLEIFDVNKHTIDVLQKQISIKEESERLDKKAVESSFKLITQDLEIESLLYQIKNGEVDKLGVLEKQLSLLKDQSVVGLDIFDVRNHTKDILEKELAIKNELVSKEERLIQLSRDREYFTNDKAQAQGITFSYEEQASRQAKETILALNTEAKKLNVSLLTEQEKDNILKFTEDNINPSFSKGIADAFGVDTNKSLKDSLKDLGGILGNIAGNALSTISASYAQSGDINQAIDEYTDSNALRDGLKNSGNPYAIFLGYASEIISGALTEQQNDFQAMEVNIGADNTGIADSLEVLKNSSFPQLEHTKSMRRSLENMDRNFSYIAIAIASGGNYDYSGADFNSQISYDPIGVSVAKVANSVDLLSQVDSSGFISSLTTGVITSIFGSSKSEVVKAGLTFGTQTVEAFMEGVNVRSYTDTKTETKRVFGLIKSTSYNTSFGSVDASLKERFSESLRYGYEAILEGGIALGFSDSNLQEALNKATISLGKFNFKGMNQEAISKTLAGVFGTQLSSITEQVLPIIGEFKQIDEDYFKALSRTASAYEEAREATRRLGIELVDLADIENKRGNVALEATRDSILSQEGQLKANEEFYKTVAYQVETSQRIGWITVRRYVTKYKQELDSALVVDNTSLTSLGELVKNFNGSTVELIDFYRTLDDFQFQLRNIGMGIVDITQDMIYGAEGLDNLVRGQSSFIDLFYTEQEKSELAISSLNREFEKLNLTMPETKDAYREMMESITDPTLYGQAVVLAGEVDSAMSAYTQELLKQHQATESNYISIYDLIDEKEQELSDLREQQYDDEVARQESLIQLTQDLFKGVESSFQLTINKILGIDDSSDNLETKRANLIAFNKAQNEVQTALTSGADINSEAFKASADILNKSALYLDTFDRWDVDMVSQLRLDILSMDDAEKIGKVHVIEDSSSSSSSRNLLSEEQIRILGENSQQADFLNQIVARDDSVARFDENQALNFAMSNNYNFDQTQQLLALTQDGYLTRTEIESLSGFTQAQLDELRQQSGIFGFAKGGYTGNGGINEIAGVVHGQEYVVPHNGALVQTNNNGVLFKEMILELKALKKELKEIKEESKKGNNLNSKNLEASAKQLNYTKKQTIIAMKNEVTA